MAGLKAMIKKYFLIVIIILSGISGILCETENTGRSNLNLTDDEIEWLNSHPTIRVAHDGYFPPYSFIDETGQFKGYAIDILNIIKEKTGLEVETYPNPIWGEIFSAAKKKEIDVLSVMIDTPDRRNWFVFSNPYIFKSQVVITNSEYNKIKERNDLAGKTVAMVRDYQYVDIALKDYPTIKPYYVDNVLDSLLAVSTGKADAAISTSGVAYYFMKKYLLNNLKFATLFSKDTSYESFGIRKDWPQLASIINKVLRSIPEAQIFELENRWYTDDFTLRPTHQKMILTSKEESWLKKNKEVVLGFYPSMEPLLIKGKNNTYKGIYPEVLKKIEEILDIRIHINADNWKVLEKKILNRELDGIIATSKKEAENYNLTRSKTLHLFYPVAFTNSSSKFEITSIKDVEGKIITFNKESRIINELISPLKAENTIIESENIQDALKLVSEGKSDIAIGINFDNYILNNSLLTNLKMTYLDVDTITPISIGIRKDSPEMLSVLNKALSIIGKDKIQQIQENWIGNIKNIDNLQLTDEEKEWLIENPVIRVGNEPDYAPYDFQIDGEPAGYSIEYIKLITELLGLETVYVQANWDNLNKMIKEKKVDLIHPVSPISKLHSNYLNFTKPFKKGVTCLVVKRDSHNIRDITDLENKKIAIASGDAVIEGLKKHIKSAKYKYKANYKEALLSVSNEEADLMVIELSVASYLINKLSLDNLVIIDEKSIRNIRDMEYHIGVRKDWDILVSLFDKATSLIPEKSIRKLDNNWLQDSNELTLTTRELEWLETHPVIRVGSDKAWAPIEFQDSDGQFYGLAIDYMNRIEEMLGIRFEYTDEDWKDLIHMAKKQQIDMFSCIAQTPERQEYLLFTDNYIEIPTGIFAKEGVGYISNLELLNNKKVAVVEGYAIQEFLVQNYPDINLYLVKNPDDGIKSVISGDAFCYLDNVITTGHIISKKGYLHIELVGETSFINKQAIGVRKDWKIFRDILQKAISSISTLERNAIYNRWISITYDKPFDYSLIWKAGIIIFAVIILILFWNRKLAVEVQKRTNELLSKEREYKTIFETATDSIMVMNQNSVLLYCNNRTVEMFGFTSKKEIIGKTPADFSPELQSDGKKSVTKVKEIVTSVLDGEPKLVEWKHIKSDGTLFDAEVSLILFERENERRVAAFVRDISERKQFEEEKRRLSTYLENIINSMPSLIIGINNGRIVTQWNKIAEEYTGNNKEDSLNRNLYDAYPQLNAYKEIIDESITKQRIKHLGKEKVKINNITRFLDITIFPLIDDGTEGAVIRIDDVTDKVQIEEMMVQSEKMLFVGNMAAGMAHEINNPMSSLLQGTQTIQQRLAGDVVIPANEKAAEEAGITIEGLKKFMNARKIYRMLEDVRSSGIRVAGIVENMLSFTRKAEGKKSLHNINKLVDKTIELAASDFDLKKNYDFKSISIRREYEDNLPWINCEAAKLQQVVLNILGNGAHAMTGAGIDNPHFIIRTNSIKDKKEISIEIEDNGPGIEEKNLKHIFEPFFTTKPPGVGTGLGLSVSYFIITEDHGGDMKVESKPGKGTTFIVTLPV